MFTLTYWSSGLSLKVGEPGEESGGERSTVKGSWAAKVPQGGGQTRPLPRRGGAKPVKPGQTARTTTPMEARHWRKINISDRRQVNGGGGSLGEDRRRKGVDRLVGSAQRLEGHI